MPKPVLPLVPVVLREYVPGRIINGHLYFGPVCMDDTPCTLLNWQGGDRYQCRKCKRVVDAFTLSRDGYKPGRSVKGKLYFGPTHDIKDAYSGEPCELLVWQGGDRYKCSCGQSVNVFSRL